MTPEKLISMSAEEFNQVVNDDVRAVEPIDALRDPIVVERWLQALLSIKRKIEGQFSVKKFERYQLYGATGGAGPEYAKGTEDYATWIRATTRFRNGVEDKLAEARSLSRRFTNDYRQAIINHYQAVNSPEFDEEDVDSRLWATVGLNPNL